VVTQLRAGITTRTQGFQSSGYSPRHVTPRGITYNDSQEKEMVLTVLEEIRKVSQRKGLKEITNNKM